MGIGAGGSILLYRAMRRDFDGFPVVGPSARTLGVRPGGSQWMRSVPFILAPAVSLWRWGLLLTFSLTVDPASLVAPAEIPCGRSPRLRWRRVSPFGLIRICLVTAFWNRMG
jgi:hypothetical protein